VGGSFAGSAARRHGFHGKVHRVGQIQAELDSLKGSQKAEHTFRAAENVCQYTDTGKRKLLRQ